MDVSDADNLTETEAKKKSNIDKALEKKALRMLLKPSLKIQIPLIKMDLQDMLIQTQQVRIQVQHQRFLLML